MGQGNGTTNGPNGPINLPRFTWCSPFLWKIFSQIHKKIPEFSINTLTIIDYWKAAHWNEAVYIGATKTPKKIRRCQSGLRQHSRTNSCSRLWKQLIKNWSTWDLRGKPSRSWHGLNVANMVENVVDVVENDGKWWKMGILKPNPPIDFTWFHHCPRKIKEVWMSFDKRSAAGVLLPKRQLPRIPQFQHALKIAREPGNRLGTVSASSLFTAKPCEAWRNTYGFKANSHLMVLSENGRHSNWPYGCLWKCCVPLNPMVLLIIIPIKWLFIKWLFHWEY